ncbi:MAG: argininosuccinate lyase [Desulfosarcina sp.]|nr:argininosuccinate lyase [Desulfobacterales bacterium]
MSAKLWDGRFAEKTDRVVEKFTSSIDVDRRLYRHDIDGSSAHCRMLARAGIISAEEMSTLIEGLGKIRQEIESGQFVYDDSLEDIHMHIEARLFHLVGKVARKLHTARSRNDQVALDARLYLREETRNVIAMLKRLREVLVDMADDQIGHVMPGYTHLQRAQPVLLSHHLLAYYEMFTRDSGRFADAHTRMDVNPLGCAALAGTTFPIDRAYTTELLSFPAAAANSMDAVADRDFMLEFMAAASIGMVHFSRMAEELILWSSSEFGFIELPDAFATGSSIMPQKKNPDVPELVRGKTGRVFGDLMALLTTMKSLPLAYNRDMQEDKATLFSSVDTLKAVIEVVTRMLPHIRFHTETMRRESNIGFLNATDMADYLVGQGMAFREAHAVVGRAVAYALSKGQELYELILSVMIPFSDLIYDDLFEALRLERVIDRRTSSGGTATTCVAAAIQKAREDLQSESLTGEEGEKV